MNKHDGKLLGFSLINYCALPQFDLEIIVGAWTLGFQMLSEGKAV